MRTYKELVEEAIEILKNEEVFVKCCEELDSWNGFLDDNRLYPMDELDDLFCGCHVSEFAAKIGRNFNFYDDYIQFTIYGIESTNSTPYEVYRDIYDEGDILDEILDKYSNLDINWIDSDLDEILNNIEEIKSEE